MSDFLVEVLYLIAGGLLLPVLLVLFAFMAGRSWRSAVWPAKPWIAARPRPPGGAFWPNCAPVRPTPTSSTSFPCRATCGVFAASRHRIQESPLGLKKCLDDLEIDVARRLARLSLATRVGPMLGLVGTLIPLGPALTGLAAGRIEVLAGNLIIAFTTTVFGILIGGLAYAMGLVRRAWYEQDLSDLEFLVAMKELRQRAQARRVVVRGARPCLTIAAAAGMRSWKTIHWPD